MTDLTQALTQIVQSLMEIISASKQPKLQPEEPRMKKTADLTYHEFLRKVLAGKDALPVNSKKMSYRLQEDLELLLELSDHNQISVKTFENIAAKKRISRTAESLRSRYSDYLHRIEEQGMKKIVSWIEKQGLEGYLTFVDDEMVIDRTEPKEAKKEEAEKKRQRPVSLDKEVKKQEKVSKHTKLANIPANCKELNQVLRIYSKMVNMPVKTLLQRLEQLSGDLVDLDTYIETKDSRLLWTTDEDEILAKGGAELEILRRYRGNGVDKRKKYLGI